MKGTLTNCILIFFCTWLKDVFHSLEWILDSSLQETGQSRDKYHSIGIGLRKYLLKIANTFLQPTTYISLLFYLLFCICLKLYLVIPRVMNGSAEVFVFWCWMWILHMRSNFSMCIYQLHDLRSVLFCKFLNLRS